MKGWRTLIFNVFAMIIPILEMTEIRDVVPDDYLPWYALALAIANMILRAVTTSPLGHK